MAGRGDRDGDRDVVYGRNAVEEARRGRRRVHREWTSDELPAAELTRLAGSPDHQGIVAEVDPYPYADPTTLLAASDALVVALDQVQDPRNLGAVWLAEAKRAGAWVYGARAGAPTRYDAVDWDGRVVLVLGGEGKGIRPRVAGACDAMVAIPRAGRVESLNVAAAASVLLFEATRQRRDSP